MLKTAFYNGTQLRAGWRFALYVSLVLGLGIGLNTFLRAVLHFRLGTPPTASNFLLSELFLLFVVVVPALVMGYFEHRTLGQYGLPIRPALGRLFWEGTLWGGGLQCATIAVLLAMGACRISGMAENLAAGLEYGSIWGIVFILVGITEEFAFRGYSQFTLTTGIGFWPAAVLLSVGFGTIHLANGGETWLGSLGIFIAAMVLVLPLRRTGMLWFSIGMHAAWDWTETYCFGVPNSGRKASGYLLNTSFSGSKWLTGGSAGPEASIVALILLILTFMLLHIRFRKARYSSTSVGSARVAAPGSPSFCHTTKT